ncbi:MAG TPA: polymer-forming cytoskeletal protein [Labilithrix sp.]|jgi:cytoskeletal protein CcmA (bactofilin family)|nr:polymer-forming cytoskeletal protein [Labilithrix sp.]
MNDPKNPNTSSTQKRTLIEEGTRFKGSLSSTCPIVVQGSVEGDVDGPAVTVSATGTVSGVVVAGSLKSEGKIAGDFDVETAQLAGTVEKDTVIRATSLDLKLTVASGKAQLTFGPPRLRS